jgi:hypothetical protein
MKHSPLPTLADIEFRVAASNILSEIERRPDGATFADLAQGVTGFGGDKPLFLPRSQVGLWVSISPAAHKALAALLLGDVVSLEPCEPEAYSSKPDVPLWAPVKLTLSPREKVARFEDAMRC